jgi:hypothetical protein
VVRACYGVFMWVNWLIHSRLSSTDGGRSWPMSELYQHIHYVAIIFITSYLFFFDELD